MTLKRITLATRAVARIRKFMDRGDMTTAAKQAGCMWYRTGWDDGFNAGMRAARTSTAQILTIERNKGNIAKPFTYRVDGREVFLDGSPEKP